MTDPDQPTLTDGPIRRFALRPIQRLGKETLVSLGALIALALGLVLSFEASQPGYELPITLGAALAIGLPIVVVAVLALVRRGQPPLEIVTGPGGISFPRIGGESFTLPYDQVTNVELRGRGLRTIVVIETSERQLVLPANGFEPPATAVELVEAIRAGIGGKGGDGRARLAYIDRLADLARSLEARRPIITWTVVAIVAAVFGLEWIYGALSEPLGVIDLGANASILVRAGQVDRLLASTFLHGSPIHAYLACAGLLAVGPTVERILGREAMLVVFVVSAIGAGLAAAAGGDVSMGATGALFGLIGSLGTLMWVYGADLPFTFRRRWSWWVVVLFANAILPAFVPNLDILAHLGGLVAGGLVTFAIASDRPLTPTGVRTGPAVGAGAWAVVLLTAAACTMTALRARSPRFEDRMAVLDAIEADSPERAMSLNNVAWMVAIDPKANEKALETARRAAERAAKRLRQNDDALATLVTIDTIATLDLRLGRLDRAIALERLASAGNARLAAGKDDQVRTVAEREHPVFGTQLARFMLARLEKQPDAEDRRAKAELVTKDGATKLALDLEAFAGRRVHAYLLGMRGPELAALIEVCAGPGHEPKLELDLRGEPFGTASSPTALKIGLVEATDPNVPKVGAAPFAIDELRLPDGKGPSNCAQDGAMASAQVTPMKPDILAQPR